VPDATSALLARGAAPTEHVAVLVEVTERHLHVDDAREQAGVANARDGAPAPAV
jgi:hypothetical protein